MSGTLVSYYMFDVSRNSKHKSNAKASLRRLSTRPLVTAISIYLFLALAIYMLICIAARRPSTVRKVKKHFSTREAGDTKHQSKCPSQQPSGQLLTSAAEPSAHNVTLSISFTLKRAKLIYFQLRQSRGAPAWEAIR